MPSLAAFPKAFMVALCKEGTMTVSEWIKLASTLDVQGLEWYAGFLEMADEKNWPRFRREVEDTGKVIPMMCCSPDFTHPDAAFPRKGDRQAEALDRHDAHAWRHRIAACSAASGGLN
jgi:sugar phosphate isomerase/epimerase